MGLAASVGLLRAIEATGKPENVLGVWAAVQVAPSPLATTCTRHKSTTLEMGISCHHAHADTIKLSTVRISGASPCLLLGHQIYSSAGNKVLQLGGEIVLLIVYSSNFSWSLCSYSASPDLGSLLTGMASSCEKQDADDICTGNCTQVLHSLLRYKSLAVLQFPSLNQKRACLLATAHVAGQPLPGDLTDTSLA